MDLRIRFLYQVNLAMFLFFTYCHSIASDPVKRNMLETILACDSVKFLRNSSYVNKCSALSYPGESVNSDTDKDIHFMCATLSHITSKICEYRVGEMSDVKLPETAEKFDEQVKQLEPKSEDRTKFVAGWCQNVTLLLNISIQNDTNVSYTKTATEILLDKTECTETCQIRHGVNPFCMVFFWFNRLYNASLKHVDISKEAPRQESVPESSVHHSAGKQIIYQDNKNHSNGADHKSAQQQLKSPKFPDTNIEIPDNLKGEQQVIKNLEQSEADNREAEQKQDPKLSSSTDNKLNPDVNKVENSKIEFQERGDDFTDGERKKAMGEGADGDNDHDIAETDKEGSFSDTGDQHSYLESPVIKEQDESHFFVYFSILSFACVLLYIGYHNKQKILAIVVEGRQSRRGRSNRRRPNTANYRKLDSNLEEAVTSQCNSNVTHVIY